MRSFFVCHFTEPETLNLTGPCFGQFIHEFHLTRVFVWRDRVLYMILEFNRQFCFHISIVSSHNERFDNSTALFMLLADYRTLGNRRMFKQCIFHFWCTHVVTR